MKNVKHDEIVDTANQGIHQYLLSFVSSDLWEINGNGSFNI